MTVATKEILELCEMLPPEKQAVVADFARYLAERTTQDGDAVWERILDDPRPRPKLEAFLEASRAEGAAVPLAFEGR